MNTPLQPDTPANAGSAHTPVSNPSVLPPGVTASDPAAAAPLPQSAVTSPAGSVNPMGKKFGMVFMRLAWTTDIGLCALGLLIAGFNALSVWTGGQRLQAVMLAAGWVVVAMFEAAIPALAGAARLTTKLTDKALAFAGVFAVGLLGAWTAYEFLEFSSFFITEEPRRVAIQVAAQRRDLAQLKIETTGFTARHRSASDELNQLTEDQTRQLDEVASAHTKVLTERKAVLDARIAGLRANLPASTATGDSTAGLIRTAEENIRKIEADRDRDLKALEEQAEKESSGRELALQGQRAELQAQIEKLLQSMAGELNAVTGWLQEAKKKQVRDRYDTMIAPIQARITLLHEESTKLRAGQSSSRQAAAEARRTAAAERIQKEEARLKTLRDEWKLKEDVSHGLRTQESARIAAEIARHQRDYDTATDAAQKQVDARLAEIRESFAQRIQPLMSHRISEGELQKVLADNQDKVHRLEEETNRLEAETDARNEKFLYYRIAKWFAAAPGLPSKDAYLRAQLWVFAPLGVLMSFVAVALGYIGAGLESGEDMFSRGNRGEVEKMQRAHERALEEQCRKAAADAAKLEEKSRAQEKKIGELESKVVVATDGKKAAVERTASMIEENKSLQQQLAQAKLDLAEVTEEAWVLGNKVAKVTIEMATQHTEIAGALGSVPTTFVLPAKPVVAQNEGPNGRADANLHDHGPKLAA